MPTGMTLPTLRKTNLCATIVFLSGIRIIPYPLPAMVPDQIQHPVFASFWYSKTLSFECAGFSPPGVSHAEKP